MWLFCAVGHELSMTLVETLLNPGFCALPLLRSWDNEKSSKNWLKVLMHQPIITAGQTREQSPNFLKWFESSSGIDNCLRLSKAIVLNSLPHYVVSAFSMDSSKTATLKYKFNQDAKYNSSFDSSKTKNCSLVAQLSK